MADEWADPPLSARARVAVDSFGWLVLIGMGYGTRAWFRALRRLL